MFDNLFSRKARGVEARERVREGALLLDVRTAGEFAGGHIAGAIHIPVQELAQRLGELGPTDRHVVVYCRSGRRSATAMAMLRKAGFEVTDLGPMSAW